MTKSKLSAFAKKIFDTLKFHPSGIMTVKRPPTCQMTHILKSLDCSYYVYILVIPVSLSIKGEQNLIQNSYRSIKLSERIQKKEKVRYELLSSYSWHLMSKSQSVISWYVVPMPPPLSCLYDHFTNHLNIYPIRSLPVASCVQLFIFFFLSFFFFLLLFFPPFFSLKYVGVMPWR